MNTTRQTNDTAFLPLVVWIQQLDEFSCPIGEPGQAIDGESLMQAQVTDLIEDCPVVGNWGDRISGTWIVQSRTWHGTAKPGVFIRALTINVQQA